MPQKPRYLALLLVLSFGVSIAVLPRCSQQLAYLSKASFRVCCLDLSSVVLTEQLQATT